MNPPDAFDDEHSLDEHPLAGLADAILDGTPTDWTAATPGGTYDEELAHQLRLVAGVVALHRTPTGEEPAAPSRPPIGSWGHLQLLEAVGQGAFGDVYRAWDPRLSREVAVKLLSGPAATDAEQRNWVIHEARCLAAIRHPNVVTVHGADRVDGRVGFWTEFIHGQTLAAMVQARGPFSAIAAMAIGIDLCRAVQAVHQAGLLHRDIKATNVMQEDDGRIVLLDFGTSRNVAGVLDALSRSAYPTGATGTPLYLAPELWHGGTATPQSDLYSVGVVLYYLVTGTYPVRGLTVGELGEAHRAGRHTPLASERPGLPAPFVAVLKRALNPDPGQRFESARAFEAALGLAQTSVAAASRPWRWRPIAFTVGDRRPMIAVGALTLVVVGASVLGVGLLRHRDAVTPDSALALAAPFTLDVRPLTFTGDVGAATISRDGKVVAFLRKKKSLWVRHIDSGVERQLILPESARELYGLTFTPDGASVDVCEERGQGPLELLRVPISGRDPWRIAVRARTAPGWSPDGKRMAFIAGSISGDIGFSRVVIADADGSNSRELASLRQPKSFITESFPIFPATARPAWSPDGRTIAVAGVNMAPPEAWATVILVDVATGAQREIAAPEQLVEIIEIAWIDQTRLAVNRQATADGPFQIWTLDSQTGAFSPVTRDLASYKGISITSDRQALVSTRAEDRQGIWAGGPGGEGMSVVIPESSARPGAASFDAQGDLVYSAVTTNGSAVWLLRAGATTPRVIALGTYPLLTTRGDAIVFADVSHHPGLDRVDIDGSHLAQLLSGSFDYMTTVTPDGATAIFADDRSGLQSLWTVGLSGGVPTELIHRFAVSPSVSLDGRRLLFGSADATSHTHGVIVVCDLPACRHARELPRPPGFTEDHTWTPDSRGQSRSRET